MKQSDTVIIFVQASRDIVYALQLIEEHRACITEVYVVDHFSNFQVFKSIKNMPEEVSVRFVRNFKFSNPLNVIADAIRLRWLYMRNFFCIRNSKVFFFSNYFDYKTFYLVTSLSKRNEVHMVDHYGIDRPPIVSYTYSDYLRQFVIWIITFRKCFFTGETHVPTFDLSKYKINRIEDVVINYDLIGRYKSKPELPKKSVIIFDMVEPEYLFVNYDSVLAATVQAFIDAGYVVYIKPHPRAKVPDSIASRNEVSLFQSNKPSELIDFSAFEYSVAAVSAAICSCGVRKRSMSLIELLSFHNVKKKHEYKQYLRNLDKDIYFPKSFDDILFELS